MSHFLWFKSIVECWNENKRLSAGCQPNTLIPLGTKYKGHNIKQLYNYLLFNKHSITTQFYYIVNTVMLCSFIQRVLCWSGSTASLRALLQSVLKSNRWSPCTSIPAFEELLVYACQQEHSRGLIVNLGLGLWPVILK